MALDYLNKLGRARDMVTNISQSPVGEVVRSFASNTIKQMQDELAKQNRNANGSLSSSLSFNIQNEEGGGISVEFLANNYWDFINSGVNGVENNFGSPYSFRSLNPSPAMLSAFTGTGSLRGWMAARGITSLSYDKTIKDSKGNVVRTERVDKQLSTESDYEGAAWVFAKAVKKNGIRPSKFVDNVFTEEALERFENDIVEAFQSMF